MNSRMPRALMTDVMKLSDSDDLSHTAQVWNASLRFVGSIDFGRRYLSRPALGKLPIEAETVGYDSYTFRGVNCR